MPSERNRQRSGQPADRPLLSGRVVASLVPRGELPRCATRDLLLLEPIGNTPDGDVVDLVEVVKTVGAKGSPRTMILDKTLDPFCLDRVIPILPQAVVLVAIDSLTKFAQLGANVAIGGIASFIAKGEEARIRARAIATRVRDLIAALGQHMDIRLALAMAPDRMALETRISRMRRNALLLASWLRKDRPDVVGHADNGDVCSTLVYLAWTIPAPQESQLDFASHLEKLGVQGSPTSEWREAYGAAVFDYLGEALAGSDLTSPVRFGTSFGFSRTSIGSIPLRDMTRFCLRVSAGVESIEGLREIYLGLREVVIHEAIHTRKRR